MFKGFDFIKKLLYGFRIRFSGFPVPLHPEYQPLGGSQNTGCGRQVRLEHPFHGREAGQGGMGACMRRTLSGEAITAASCTFSVGLVNSRTSSGFFCTAAICTFSVGSLILWIASGLSRTAASCARSCNRLFSFGMAVSFLCYISGAMIGGYSATVLHLTKIKRISGTHVRDIRKWNSRWCGRFRPLQSFPCTA